MSRIFLAIVLVATAIIAQPSVLMAHEIPTTPCTLTVERAAKQLTGDVANAVYMTQGTNHVVYDGPEVLVTGRRDIRVYDWEWYTPNGRPLLRGSSHLFVYFHAICVPRPSVSFRWKINERCQADWNYIQRLTGAREDHRGWGLGRLNGDYSYQGRVKLDSFWVPADMVVYAHGVSFDPGNLVPRTKTLHLSCMRDYWKNR